MPERRATTPCRRQETEQSTGSEAAQADCSKRFCDVDRGLPTQYNLVLESETVAPENAAT